VNVPEKRQKRSRIAAKRLGSIAGPPGGSRLLAAAARRQAEDGRAGREQVVGTPVSPLSSASSADPGVLA
jgi:hypothetical protein